MFNDEIVFKYKGREFRLESIVVAEDDEQNTIVFSPRVWEGDQLLNAGMFPHFQSSEDAIDWAFNFAKNITKGGKS